MGDTLVALAPDAGWPGDRGALADLLFPLRADLRQVIDPIEGRARSIGAVHHCDREVRELHPWIEGGHRGVVPLLDFAQIDVGEQWPAETKLSGLHTLDIHNRNDPADHEWKLREADFPELVGRERRVGRAEIDGRGLDLRDATSGADRLIVDPRTILLAVSLRPLRQNWIYEGGTGTGDLLRGRKQRNGAAQRHSQHHRRPFHAHLLELSARITDCSSRRARKGPLIAVNGRRLGRQRDNCVSNL